MVTYKEVGSNTILNVERDTLLGKNHSITTSHDELFVGRKPSGLLSSLAGVLNEKYQPEAITSVRDAKTYNRSASRTECSCSPSVRKCVVCIDRIVNQSSKKVSILF
jgi:hypothetical protein